MAHVVDRTFVDDLGRKIFFSKVPTRIVSLAPSITEMLFALGLDAQIVGVTQFCDYPPQALAKPKVGGTLPNVESIVALKPNLVVTPAAFIQPEVLAKLEQLRIPVFVIESTSVDDIVSDIQTLGRMVDRGTAATELIMGMRRRIDAVKAQVEGTVRPRVFYVLNSNPLITVGPGSYIHHLIELAGGINIAAQASGSYPRLSIEQVLKEDPQVILFPTGDSEGIPDSEQQRWKQWPSLSAVKTGRFSQIPSVLGERPGPRVVDALERLFHLLHPEHEKARQGS